MTCKLLLNHRHPQWPGRAQAEHAHTRETVIPEGRAVLTHLLQAAGCLAASQGGHLLWYPQLQFLPRAFLTHSSILKRSFSHTYCQRASVFSTPSSKANSKLCQGTAQVCPPLTAVCLALLASWWPRGPQECCALSLYGLDSETHSFKAFSILPTASLYFFPVWTSMSRWSRQE